MRFGSSIVYRILILYQMSEREGEVIMIILKLVTRTRVLNYELRKTRSCVRKVSYVNCNFILSENGLAGGSNTLCFWPNERRRA